MHHSAGIALGALFLSFTLLAFAVFIGGNPLAMIMPPYALIGLLLLVVLVSSSIIGWESFFTALREGITLNAPPERLAATLSHLRMIDQTIIASGGTMVLLGLIAMLARSSEPSTIGPSVAFALNTSVLTIFISRLLLFPLIQRVRGTLGWPAAAARERLLGNLAWIILPLANLLGFLLVLFTLKGGN